MISKEWVFSLYFAIHVLIMHLVLNWVQRKVNPKLIRTWILEWVVAITLFTTFYLCVVAFTSSLCKSSCLRITNNSSVQELVKKHFHRVYWPNFSVFNVILYPFYCIKLAIYIVLKALSDWHQFRRETGKKSKKRKESKSMMGWHDVWHSPKE